jgi:hypothetical protein
VPQALGWLRGKRLFTVLVLLEYRSGDEKTKILECRPARVVQTLAQRPVDILDDLGDVFGLVLAGRHTGTDHVVPHVDQLEHQSVRADV